MSSKKQKFRLRSIRIPLSIEEVLVKEAGDRGVSVNSLINEQLSAFTEWYRFSEKTAYASFNPKILCSMFDVTDRQAVVDLAERLGPEVSREMTLFVFGKFGFEQLVSYFVLICKHAQMVRYQMSVEGGLFVAKLAHRLGENFSVFFAKYFGAAFRELGIEAASETGASSIAFRLPVTAEEAASVSRVFVDLLGGPGTGG